MQNWELSYRSDPTPPDPVQFRQYTRAIPGGKLHPLEFPLALGPHAQAELARVLIPA